MMPPAVLTLAADLVRDEVLAPLREHRARLAERYGVRYLRLFGSVARGEASERSDVDLIVEFDPDRITLTSFLDFTDELEALLHRRVDVVSLAKLTPRLRAHVEAETRRCGTSRSWVSRRNVSRIACVSGSLTCHGANLQRSGIGSHTPTTRSTTGSCGMQYSEVSRQAGGRSRGTRCPRACGNNCRRG